MQVTKVADALEEALHLSVQGQTPVLLREYSLIKSISARTTSGMRNILF